MNQHPTARGTSASPLITIMIKALNEERNIAAAIETSLAAIEGLDGEVILADSASTDRTVEIARRYPITVVTLDRIADRCCGAGAQLGYQYARGEFVCIVDGDMHLDPNFIRVAIDWLRQNPGFAGVGGIIRERDTSNVEFHSRETRRDPDREPGTTNRLDCGGVYRQTAIRTVGHFANRNLHGGEELDLGARLRAAGWKLARLDHPAIDHFGHTGGDYRLLARRIRGKTARGAGEVMRAALGKPHFPMIFENNNGYALCVAVHGWWIALLAIPFLLPGIWAAVAWIAVFVLPFAVMSARWRSLRYGIYAVASWNVYTAAFWTGLFGRYVDPSTWIDSHVVAMPDARSASRGEANQEATPT